MTWANITSLGRGKLALRLQIEGHPYEFVTDTALAGTQADGRIRVAGLVASSVTWGERCSPADAELEQEGFTAEIVDRQLDGIVTTALAKKPPHTTFLVADASKTATTLTVSSTSGFADPEGPLHVGTEKMSYTTLTPTTFNNITRGEYDSIAQAHFTSDGELLGYPSVTDLPESINGRRVRVYAYGEGETGAGTLVFRGVCSTDASLDSDGCTWRFGVDGLWSICKADLGADLNRIVRPRGIYFQSMRPLLVDVTEVSLTTGLSVNAKAHVFEGHYEDAAELADAIQGAFDFSSWPFITNGGDIRFVARDDGSIVLTYYTGSGTSTFIQAMVDWAAARVYVTDTLFNEGTGAAVTQFEVASQNSYTTAAAVFGNPMGTIGQFSPNPVEFGGIPLGGLTYAYPRNRIYLDADISTDTDRLISLDFGGDIVRIQVSSSDADERWIQFPGFGDAYGWGGSMGQPPEMQFHRIYTTGDLGDFRDNLVNNAAARANKGISPFVTASDLASWTTVVDEASAGRPLVRGSYTASASTDLDETIVESCKMLGLFPHSDTGSKIALSRMRIPLSTDIAAHTLDESTILVDRGMPTWEWAPDGHSNTVEFSTGWDGEDYTGDSIIVRDVAANAVHRNSRTITIEPKYDTGEGTYADYVELARPVFGAFGGRYSYVMMDIPMSLFAMRPGDIVSITHHAIPDPVTGTRGVTAAPGLVLGVWWEPSAARGRVLAYISHERYAGYSPSWEVTAQTNTSGNVWDLTLTDVLTLGTATMSQSGSVVLSDHFTVTDRVEIYRWDDATPSLLVGTVGVITDGTGVMRVTFDSAWTPGAYTWIVRYASAAVVTANQEQYVHIADSSDGDISYASGAVPPWVMA